MTFHASFRVRSALFPRLPRPSELFRKALISAPIPRFPRSFVPRPSTLKKPFVFNVPRSFRATSPLRGEYPGPRVEAGPES